MAGFVAMARVARKGYLLAAKVYLQVSFRRFTSRALFAFNKVGLL
jgi:hypothetical protein